MNACWIYYIERVWDLLTFKVPKVFADVSQIRSLQMRQLVELGVWKEVISCIGPSVEIDYFHKHFDEVSWSLSLVDLCNPCNYFGLFLVSTLNDIQGDSTSSIDFKYFSRFLRCIEYLWYLKCDQND